MAERHVEQIEVIERSVVESRRPLSDEEALNYFPSTETRTIIERYTHNGAGNVPPLPFDAIDSGATDHYYLTGECEKDTSILYNLDQTPPSAPAVDRSTQYGVNNYGYDLHEVYTPGGGVRVFQTHGSGDVFSPVDNRSLADGANDSSFIAQDRSLDASVLQSAGNSRLLSAQPPVLPAGLTAYRENASREIVESRSPAGGIPYTSVTAPPLSADGSPDQLHSILKNAEKRYPSSEDKQTNGWLDAKISYETVSEESLKRQTIRKQCKRSLSRKDSYRRMQEGQDPAGHHNTSFYASSATSSKAPSQHQWTFANGRRQSQVNGGGSNVFSDMKNFFSQVRRQIRSTEWTPRLVGIWLLIALLVFLLLFVAWLIFSSWFAGYSQRSYLLYPPACEECIRRNPSAAVYKAPSQLFVHLASPAQAHFELAGNPPFKSNSFTAIDFYTGYVAIADHALTDEHGRHTTCFLMELDRTALPDMSTLIDALDNTYHEIRSQFGWQEYWQYNAEPIDEGVARDKFRQEISDCEHAKWYFLRHTIYTKGSSCSSCYDFCLPDYAVLRRAKYEDEPSLSLRRLNCFRLYVPEWSRYRVETDETGGHWSYPKQQIQRLRLQNQAYDSQGLHGDTNRFSDLQFQQQPLNRQQREPTPLTVSQQHQLELNRQQRQREQYHLVGSWVDAGAH